MRRIVLLTCVLAAGCGGPAPAPSPYPPAPGAAFVQADGTPMRLAALRGKYVVLLFMRGYTGDFACTFCTNQTVAYEKAYRRFADAGAEVVAVLPGTREGKLVPEWLDKVAANHEPEQPTPYRVPFPVVIDADLSATHAFGIPTGTGGPFPVSRPATVVIDPQGRIRCSYLGRDPRDRPKLEDVLAEIELARAGQPPRMSAGAPSAEAAGASLPWETSLGRAMIRAREEKKPVLVDFYADW